MPFKTSYNAGLGTPTINLAGVDVGPPKVAVGTIVRGYDDLLGEGEFVYLPGAAGVSAGTAVVYDLVPGGQFVSPVLAATHVTTSIPVAVAVAAVPAGSFGWYQMSGVTIALAIAATVAGRAFGSATAGQVTSTAAAGVQILGARISSAVGTPAAGQVYLTLNRPMMQGQIT